MAWGPLSSAYSALVNPASQVMGSISNQSKLEKKTWAPTSIQPKVGTRAIMGK